MGHLVQARLFCSALSASALCVSALFGSSTATAAPRCATIVIETVDGKPAELPFADAAFTEALLAAGLEPVDEAQSRKIRAALDPRDWIDGDGKLASTITPRDADVIIALVSRLARLQSPMLSKSLQRIDAIFSAKIIAVDSGKVIAALTSQGEGLGHSSAEAATSAAKAAASRLVKELERTLREHEPLAEVELVVSGLKDASALSEVRDGLAAIPAIKGVKILASDPGGAKLSLRVAAISTDTLALAIERSPSLSLFVYAISPRALRAERRKEAIEKARTTTADRPLSIRSMVLEPVRPAETLAFPDRPLGKIVLANDGAVAIEASLTLHGPELLAEDAALPRTKIGPRKQIEVPVRLPIDAARLKSSRDRRAIPLRLEVEYRLGDEQIREETTALLPLEAKNSMSWSKPDDVAAFVTARSEPILRYARALRDAIPAASSSDPRALPLAIFVGLQTSSIAYAPDPSGAIGSDADYVQFPQETLVRRRGDCDDLAVLMTALSEAVGVRSLLLLGPGHVLVAFNTGLPPQAARLFAREPNAFFTQDDALYLPIEATLLEKSFVDAWASAASTLEHWRGIPNALRVVDVESAWTRRPAIDLSAEADIAAPSAARLHARVRAELESMTAEQRKLLEARLVELAANPGERAVVLAQLERFDEARALLESQKPSSSLNDLANVYALQGDPMKADQTYLRALSLAGRGHAAPIRANLALAALERGDERQFARHIVACLEAGGEPLVRALARAGVESSGDVRGASTQGMSSRALRDAIARAAPRLARTLQNGETKGRLDTRLSLSRLVFWLSGARRR